MVRNTLLRSAALAVIAAAASLAAVPAQAQGGGLAEARAAAREARIQERQERRADAPQRAQGRAEARGRAGGGDGDWQSRAAARQQQRAEAAQQRSASDGGWRSRREGGDDGRNWSGRRNAASRPVPAYGGTEAQAPVANAWTGRDRATGERWRDRADRAERGGDRERIVRDFGRYGRADAGDGRSGYRDGGRYDGNAYRTTNRYDGDRYRSSTRYDRARYNWDRNDWRRDRRYDWSSYRNANRSLFSIGRYYSPYRNYSYRRLSVGLFLDSGFYGNRYWIADPWQYRLPEVYGPYRWVRYYDDVLLVDIYSGEVVDVIHGFFW